MGTVYTNANIPTGSVPTIGSFTASPVSISKGQSVTLSWSASQALYNVISPQVGPVRNSSVVVNPSASTIYTLYETNQYGRATATVSVSVH